MSEQGNESGNGEGQVPEAFAARVAQLEADAAQFSQAIQEREDQIANQATLIESQQGQIGELQVARRRESFSRQVDGLPHVGAENDALVNELMWLHGADETEGRDHFSYWSGILSTMETAMAESVAFQSVGTPGHRQGGSAFSRVGQLIAAAAEQQGLVISDGDANWTKLAEEIVTANPALYNEYMEQVRNQGRR